MTGMEGPKAPRGSWMFGAIGAVIGMVFCVAVILVAWHFIEKYW